MEDTAKTKDLHPRSWCSARGNNSVCEGKLESQQKKMFLCDVIQSRPHLNHADQWIVHVLTPELNEFVLCSLVLQFLISYSDSVNQTTQSERPLLESTSGSSSMALNFIESNLFLYYWLLVLLLS